MDIETQEPNERELESAVDLLDRLLFAADGGRDVVLGQFEASTILALLMDKPYRTEVMGRLDDFASVEPGE